MPPTRFQGAHTTNAAGNTVIDSTSPLLMDGGITIGQLPIPLNNALTLVNATLTDNNAGQNAPDISINVGAGVTASIPIVVSEYIKEVNSFLSTSSVPSILSDGSLADGSGDSPIAKGTKITGFEVAYSIQGGPLTALAARMDRVTFANGVANANTAVFPNTAAAGASLANTASATTCRILSLNIPSPAFDIVDNTYTYLRLGIVTPGGCTLRLYSIMLNFTYNYL